MINRALGDRSAPRGNSDLGIIGVPRGLQLACVVRFLLAEEFYRRDFAPSEST